MRLLSYNILDGGTGRLDELAIVIERARADVIALVEAEDADLVQQLARRLRMDFIVAHGKKGASALLTRWTLRQSINHAVLEEGISKSFLEAIVLTARGDELPVGVVHLHARAYEADEHARERELDVVLRVMEKHRQRGTPHLLCGDFNADAPTQQIDPQKCKPKTQDAWKANGGQLPRRAVRKLLDAGYIDTFRAARGDTADTIGSFTTDHPGQRVDYIFAWGVRADSVRDAWIDQVNPAGTASDHFPVGVEVGD